MAGSSLFNVINFCSLNSLNSVKNIQEKLHCYIYILNQLRIYIDKFRMRAPVSPIFLFCMDFSGKFGQIIG